MPPKSPSLIPKKPSVILLSPSGWDKPSHLCVAPKAGKTKLSNFWKEMAKTKSLLTSFNQCLLISSVHHFNDMIFNKNIPFYTTILWLLKLNVSIKRYGPKANFSSLTCITTVMHLTFIPLILNLRSLIYLPNQWACINQISFPSK